MSAQEEAANLHWGEIEAPEVRVQNASELGCVRNGDYLTLLLPETDPASRQPFSRGCQDLDDSCWAPSLNPVYPWGRKF